MAKRSVQKSKARNRRVVRKTQQKRRTTTTRPAVREILTHRGDVELKPQNLIIQMLKVGKPVSVDDIFARLGDYITNLNSHIHAIKQIGGYFRYEKAGRNVVTLHLLNHTNYDRYGQPTSKALELGLIRPETRSETIPLQQAA